MSAVKSVTLEDILIDQDIAKRAPVAEAPRVKNPASSRQLSFLGNLIAEYCDADPSEVSVDEFVGVLDKKGASAMIDSLMKTNRNRSKQVNTTNGISIPSGPPATDKQVAFVKRLIDQKGATDIDADTLTKSSASDAIEDLLARPNATSKPKSSSSSFLSVDDYPGLPAGRYAVTGEDGTTDFYVVQHGKGSWAGTLFVKLHVAGADDRNLRGSNAATIADKIISDGPLAAAVRYGNELGRCSICNHELTNADSIKAGIGPVCATKFG